MSSPSSSATPNRWGWLLLLFVLALIVGPPVGAYFLWFRAKPQPQPQPDLTEALAANNRGIGLMEQFDYPAAEKAFEEAAQLAPDWLPARINHGIATFNQNTPETAARAKKIFAEVLARDPDNKHAHFCLGIICYTFGPFPESYTRFQKVNQLDPEDPHTWLQLGMTHPDGVRSAAARECFEQALKRNPYLNGALHNLYLALDPADPRKATIDAERTALNKAERAVDTDTRYSVMGKYADVIGRDPKSTGAPPVGPLPTFEPVGLKVALAAGARWATAADLDATRRAARERFGGTVVLFDYNGDLRPDVFLASVVVENGKVRDLLLRNDGNGAFTDVTAEAGLATPRPSLGAAAADYDNDGRPDLLITGAGEQRLFRNKGNGTFEDVSAKAGLDKVKGVCLGCGWIDLDQDGDLDLILCQYAAGDNSTFEAPAAGETLVFENVGVAPAVDPKAPAPGLSTAFRRSEKFAGVIPAQAAVSFAASDLDSDRDVDLLVLLDGADPVVVENDRLMRFRRALPAWASGKAHKWNGGLVLDANHDERSDLFLVRAGGVPVYLLSKGLHDFEPGHTNSPALKQAVTADIDMDGWPDVVGLTSDGKIVLLHNLGDGRLEHAPDAFGPGIAANALAAADLDGDGAPDLLTWSGDGLKLYRNRGNGNSAVLIDPTGRRVAEPFARTHNDAFGTWIVAQSGSNWAGAERTTVTAGLGQSLLPTALGVGKHDRAEVVRLVWPDAVIQAELGIAANGVRRLEEKNRKTTSCPVLMTWDGERFVFVTDCLGAGSMGESGPDGSTRPPRPEESIKIEPGQLVPKDGQFVLKLAEPMDEVLYLDHLRLVVIDHPAVTVVFPDERFATSGPDPTQKLLAFRTRHFPKLATDDKGRDVTKLVLERDRRAVDGFAVRSWLGYAEDHSLTLEFPELPAGGKWYMVLAGWTDYPYPDAIYAATRAGIELKEPKLEKFDPVSGKWVSVCDLGFPAGLPRVMTRELPADFRGGKLRISTNMQIYWDQVFVAQAEDAEKVGKVTTLEVARADLAARGFMQEVYPDGRPPIAYDDSKTELVPVTKWKGKLTRLGDVTDLLRAADDRFVLCGPGDEITVRFDAKNLPPLPAGWQRSFVLRTRGYCKDTSVTTVTGGVVGPLPFAAMPNYPDFGGVKPPATDADKWHTRPAGGR